MTASSLGLKVNKIKGESARSVDDRVAVEEPLEIRLGYETPQGRTATSISITMRTPSWPPACYRTAEQFQGWLERTRFVENTAESIAWFNENAANIKSKQTKY